MSERGAVASRVDPPPTGSQLNASASVENGPLRDLRSHASRLVVATTQLVIFVVFLLCWQFLPTIPWLSSRFKFLDSFFISSPTHVIECMADLARGSDGSPLIWGYIGRTLSSSLIGTAIGILAGGAFGLILSNSDFWSRVLTRYLNMLNAVPRIAIVPIFIILLGPTSSASIAVAVTVVFFVCFFNAYEGGRAVPLHLVQNAKVLGASQRQVMTRVRLPYVTAWTMASIPVAIAFALTTVVTAELLSGVDGIGQLVAQASFTSNATLTFAIVMYLAVVGASVVALAQLVSRRILHWWGKA